METEVKANPNILGVIDKNEASWGKNFGNYKIFSTEILREKPADILVTIYNNHENAYKNIKEELSQAYPQIQLLDNIFNSPKD